MPSGQDAWDEDFTTTPRDHPFANEATEALRRAPDTAPAKRIDEVEEERLQRNTMRERLFRQAILLTWVVVGAGVIFLALYIVADLLQGRAVEPEVMIAWISGEVVEVLGILAIIARYLFPSRENPNRSS